MRHPPRKPQTRHPQKMGIRSTLFIPVQPLPHIHLRIGYGQTAVRPNISLGNSIAGLHAAFGTVLARGKRVVDISIMEKYLSPLYHIKIHG